MPKVVVAMSGGVDSSVAALLLKREGYEVIGVTMQIWPQPEDRDNACCGLSAVNDAKRVAFKIGIPHYTMNFEDEFGEKVIDYFCREYLAGRTPNPCIACNKELKFGSLLRKAMSLGADYIATGHYALVEQQSDGYCRYILKLGYDQSKDQTYALYQMDQFQLAHTLFPLGMLHKPEVRQLAREAGLVVAERPESQEICFISEGHYSEFVEQRTGTPGAAGEFRLVSGEWLGPHQGIHCYTVGQRKGLGLHFTHFRPVYVIRIEPETGIVWIGEEGDLYRSTLTACRTSYTADEPFTGSRRVQAKIRYNSPRVDAVATPLPDNRLLVDFSRPEKAITPGQAVVLYDGDEVLGGGTIVG